jgi:hypothetical protein
LVGPVCSDEFHGRGDRAPEPSARRRSGIDPTSPRSSAHSSVPAVFNVTAGSSLPAGVWDLVVFARSSVSGQFDAVQVVRMIAR